MLQIATVVTFLYKSVKSCLKMQKVVCHKRNVLCYNTEDEVCKTAGQKRSGGFLLCKFTERSVAGWQK